MGALYFWDEDIGQANYILKVEISIDHSKKFLSLYQETYINGILKHLCIHNCKPIHYKKTSIS